MIRRRVLTLAVLLAFAAGLAIAVEEAPDGHAKAPQKTILLDTDRIQPSKLVMDKGDVLVFQNQSVHPITVSFLEPNDVMEKIHCHLITHGSKGTPPAPWLLFREFRGKVSATIPPGRFASVCSLDPATYTFVAQREGAGTGPGGRSGVLQQKGEIVVQ